MQDATQAQERVHEEELSRRFHQVVESAEDEPVPASSSVLLESSVGGLGMDDLDDLLARLKSGGGLDMSKVARCERIIMKQQQRRASLELDRFQPWRCRAANRLMAVIPASNTVETRTASSHFAH